MMAAAFARRAELRPRAGVAAVLQRGFAKFERYRVVDSKLLNARKAEIVEQVGALISDNMINAANRSWLLIENARSSGKPAPRYVPRTDYDPRLYVNSGNLLKAASIPNAEGNVAEVRYKNGEFIVEMGVDLSVIPYFRIHE